MQGTVKRVYVDKGLGFIKGEDNIEYFFHRSALKNVNIDELEEGQDVSFEDAEGLKGPKAEDVYV